MASAAAARKGLSNVSQVPQNTPQASSLSDGSPAKVAEHVRHRRRVAVCAQIAMQTKQRASEGPGSGTRQDGAPSVQPRLAGASTQHLRNGPSLGLGEESKEGLARSLRKVESVQLRLQKDTDGVAHHRHEVVTPTWRRSPTEPRGKQEAPQRSPRSGADPWHRREGRGRAKTRSPRLWRLPRGKRAPLQTPMRSHASQGPLPSSNLRDGGQSSRVDGHTGRRERTVGEEGEGDEEEGP